MHFSRAFSTALITRTLAAGAALYLMSGASAGGAATRTWDGGGANSFWTNPTNWTGDVAPVAGDALLFPPGALKPDNTNNFPAGMTFDSISIGGSNYFLNGSNIVLNAGITTTNPQAVNYVLFPIQLASNQTFMLAGSNFASQASLLGPIDTAGRNLTFSGGGVWQVQSVISGSGSLTETGSIVSKVSLYASNTFSGPVQILGGVLTVYHGRALGTTNGNTTIADGAGLSLANPITVPEPLTLSGALYGGNDAQFLTGPITLMGANATISVGATGALTVNSVISGSGGFTKVTEGLLVLNSNNTYTGLTTVDSGTLQINGSQPASAILLNFGTLMGAGTVGTITASGSGAKTLAPGASTGILNSSNVVLTSNTTFAVELNGTTPGSGHDQLNVSGSVTLSNCALSVVLGFLPAVSNSLVIINNDGADAVSGTFAGLPEGALLTIFGTTFRVSYIGGTGNDVVLTALTLPTGSVWDGGGANGNWMTASNWLGNVAPVPGANLIFPLGAARGTNTNNFPAGTIFNSITLDGPGYSVFGTNITLNAGLTFAASGGNSVFLPILLASNQTFTATNGASVNLNGNIDTGGRDVAFAGDGNWSMLGSFTGGGSLTKSGVGGLVLFNSNAFAGPVQILQGAITITQTNGLGSTNAGTTISAGAILNMQTAGTVAEPLELAGRLSTVGAGAKFLTGPITLLASNATVTVGGGMPLTVNGVISGSGGFAKTGADALILNAPNTYTGTTTVSNGMLQVNGAQPGSAVVLVLGTLGGGGTVGPITSAGFGTVSPGVSAGVLNSSNVAFNSTTTFRVELNGASVGTGYDQLNVTGTVNLGGCVLSNSLGFAPALSSAFTIINNDGADPVTGTFSGLTNGAVFATGGLPFQISYAGGDGNDVSLTRVAPEALITNVTLLTNGSFRVQGAGVPFATYSLQASSNLMNWLLIATNTATNSGLFQFLDADAPVYSNRFYRAVLP